MYKQQLEELKDLRADFVKKRKELIMLEKTLEAKTQDFMKQHLKLGEEFGLVDIMERTLELKDD